MYKPKLAYTFPRKWKKRNTVGALINWDIKLKAGWIRLFSLTENCYLRFNTYIKYTDFDDKDIKFLEYFLYQNRIIYQHKENLIAFKYPKIKIIEVSSDILKIDISNIFLRQSNKSLLCNLSKISFEYDIKKDTILCILQEFAKDFLNDEKNSHQLCQILEKKLNIAYSNWKTISLEIETIYI